MRQLPRTRAIRLAAALLLTAAVLLPAATTVSAKDPLILRIGTNQDPSSINPWNANLVVEYEIFQLNYDLLVNFADDLSPAPGFAQSWTQSADGKSWTFKMRPDMKWSDGQPATSEDARWTLQYILDANKSGDTLGLGYISAYPINAGIASVSAPDPETLIVTTTHTTDRVLSMDTPILPKHIWSKISAKDSGNFPNTPPVVGSGPYQAVEWKTGQYIRFVRNPNYWGPQGAADEIVIRFFPNAEDTMVQAFKRGELDYIRNPSAQQFDQLKTMPGVVAIDAPSTGFDELGFNTYTKPVPGGGASTKALQDPAFRSALGYAIDRQLLLDKVHHGHGTIGTTMVPPYYLQYHIDPTDLTTFDINVAKQKLEAAGYPLNAQGQRLDKQGKPINLRLYFPNTDPTYPTDAQFITDWFGQLGITVKSQSFDSGTLTDILLGPSGKTPPKGKLAYDMFIWGWVGDNNDPNTLLQIFLCSSIGSSSDSQFCDPKYDALYNQQNESPTAAGRKDPMAQMQQLIYDAAPYQILDNSSELHVYRTDKFANWQQMPPKTGTPLFVMGNINYTQLTDATALPSPSPSSATSAAPAGSVPPSAGQSAASATPAPSGGGSGGGSSSALLLVGAVGLVAVLAVGFVIVRRGRAGGPPKEEE